MMFVPIPQKIKDLVAKVRTAVYGKDVREAIAEALEESGKTAAEAREITESLLDGSFDQGLLDTEIREKLTQLEQDYAPQLNDLGVQLAQTATEITKVSNNVVTAKDQLSGVVYDNSGSLDLASATITSDATKHLAFPTIAYFLNKYIVMYRSGTNHTSIDGKLVFKTSDNAVTWGAEQTIASLTGMDYRDPTLIVYSGKLVVKYFKHDGNGNRKTCIRHTSDLATWSSEIELPSLNNSDNATSGNMTVKDNRIFMVNYTVDPVNGYINDSYLVSTDLTNHAVVGLVKAQTNEVSIHWDNSGFGFTAVLRQSADGDGGNNNKNILVGRSMDGVNWTFKELPIRGHAPSLKAVGSKLVVTYRSLNHFNGTQFNLLMLEQNGEFSGSRIYSLFARNNWDIGYGDVLPMSDNVYFVYYNVNEVMVKSLLRSDVLALSPLRQKQTYKYVGSTIRQGDIIQQLIGDVVVTGDGTGQKDFTIDLTPLALTGQLRVPTINVAHSTGLFSVRLKSFSTTSITGTLKIDSGTFSTPITVSWSALNTGSTYKQV